MTNYFMDFKNIKCNSDCIFYISNDLASENIETIQVNDKILKTIGTVSQTKRPTDYLWPVSRPEVSRADLFAGGGSRASRKWLDISKW